MPDDPTSDIVTDNRQTFKTQNDLASQIASSYSPQTGASDPDKTLELIWKYVNVLIEETLPEFLAQNPNYIRDRVFELLKASDPKVATAIETQIADHAAGKASASNDPSQRNVEKAADPIEMFSGQFTQASVDMSINGAGMNLLFRRIYKHQAVYNGPLGANWDHSYNLYIRQLGNNVIRSTGEIREDLYTKHPLFGQAGFNYWVPPDGQSGIIEEDGTSFTWRSPNGVRYLYRQDPGDPLFHRVRRIEDRFGNFLSFHYQNDQLRRIEINNSARFAALDYDNAGRIFAVRDYTGRQWTYTYDDYNDLVGVTSPKTKRYPGGLTTTYEYSSSEYSPPLQHNLLRIIDPAGQLYLENEYGTDSALLNFNRVVRQRQGNGEYLFEYETVVNEFEFDYNDSEKPAVQVNQVLRNGQMVHFIYNTFGNLLFREEYVWQEGRRRLVQWRYRYNRDGSLIGTITPEGNVSQYYYGRDDYLRIHGITDEEVATDSNLTVSARMSFGNLLAVVRRSKRYNLAQMNLNRGVWGDFFPDILSAIDPADVIVKNTYEPDYQQILTVSDPRFTARPDPRYNETASYAQHLTRYEYSALPHKTLRRVRYPDTTFPSPLADGTVGVTDISEEYLQYDIRGRLELREDPEGNVTATRYFQGGPALTKEGYLREIVRDVNSLHLTTIYEVNDVGIPTSVTNPRGVETKFVVNELDQTIETISGGPGYRMRLLYDKNGLLERQERDNLDDVSQPSPDGDEVRTYKYDEQNNLLRETKGGIDLARHHITRHRYDGSDNRIGTIRSCGNKVRFEYDERTLLKSTTRGPSSPIASTTHIHYDGDGRRAAPVDGRGHLTRFSYDTLDRVISTTDALGNVKQSKYDKLGNVTIERFFELRADETYHLLKRNEFVYDERGSRVREINWLFLSPIAVADIDQAPDAEFISAQNQGRVTSVETQFFYDKNKRLFRTVNAKGQERTYDYDGVNRRILEHDNGGNYIRTFYDENSNIVRVDRHELVKDPLTGMVMREDVFSSVNEYDLIDRHIAAIDGLGNRTTFTYDSRNNIASVTDPLRNIRRYKYDVFGRKEREIVEMTKTGLGGGSRLPDIVTQFVYDDNDRLTSLIDPKGTITKFEYDELDRLFQTTYVDGSNIHLTYDADDNLVVRRDNNGLQMLYEFDPLSRCTRMDLDKTGLNPKFPYPAGTEEYESYSYDSLGRVLQQENDFCAITSNVDSFGRVYDERIRFTTPYSAPGGVLTLSRSFDALSNRTDITYPSGRAIHYEYDGLNRIEQITNTVKGRGYPGSATFSAQYTIATYGYRGLRLAKAAYGNQAGYALAYDGGGRLIGSRHFSSVSTMLDIQQLFDGAGNRRFQLDNPAASYRPNGETYTYDSLYRLTKYERKPLASINLTQFEPPTAPLSASAMTGQQRINDTIGSLVQDPSDYTYRYDSLGNREKERQPGQSAITYVPNPLNQYQSVDGTPFLYDMNGNLIDDGIRLYRYNYRNQLAQVLQKTTNKELLRLLYDATGRLVGIREAGQMTNLINDGLNVVEVYSGGNVASQWIYENGLDRRCQLVNGGEEWWYHCDFILSTRLLSGSSGQAVGMRYEYEPFGSLIAGPPQYNPYLFGGKWLFTAVGLYDSRARQYSPSLGRFVQRDPKGYRDGPNVYVYAGNDPLNFMDLLGTEKEAKPSAEEYFGKIGRKVSVEEQAQQGGFLRFFMSLNIATFGSAENMKMVEEQVERLRRFSYAPEDVEQGKAAEQMWAWFFNEMTIGAASQGGFADAANAARRAAPSVRVAASALTGEVASTAPGEVLGEIPAGSALPLMEGLSEAEIEVGAMSSQYFYRAPVSATEAGHAVETMIPTARWGRPGLQPGDWIMKGPPNKANYVLSFKWDPSPTNIRAPYSVGEGYLLPPEQVQWPTGWGLEGRWKGLFGQRWYVPPAVP